MPMREDINAIKSQQAAMLVILERLEEKLTRNSETLFGDGKNSPGILTRVDRLEQSHERSRWALRSLLGAVMSLFAGALWALLRRP